MYSIFLCIVGAHFRMQHGRQNSFDHTPIVRVLV